MREADLQGLIDAAVAEGVAPGVAFLLASRDDVLFQGTAGVRCAGAPAPMGLDTVVWIASMSKAPVAVAVMQCVERGLLDLDQPLAQWLHEARELQVLDGFEADGTPRLRAPCTPPTLRHLMTHTAGLPYEFFDARTDRALRDLRIPPGISGRRDTFRRPLVRDPGTTWDYGIASDWLGRVIETVSGLGLGDYLRRHVFEPLAMSSTGFRLSTRQRERMAVVHQRQSDGGLLPTRFEVPQDAECDMGGHGLYSAPGDYLRFLRMLLRGGELDGQRVLGEAQVAQLRELRLAPGILPPRLASTNLRLTHDLELDPAAAWGWSFLGLVNTQPTAQGRSPGSVAWAGLCNSYWWLDAPRNRVGLLVTQVLPFHDPRVLRLCAALEARAHDLLD